MQKLFGQGLYDEKAAPKIDKTKTHDALPDKDPENVQTFFDIEIGDPKNAEEEKVKGRVVFELSQKKCPRPLKTSELSAQARKAMT